MKRTVSSTARSSETSPAPTLAEEVDELGDGSSGALWAEVMPMVSTA